MDSIVMGNLDGDLKRFAFDIREIRKIITRYGADLVFSTDEPGLYLELDGKVCPVQGYVDRDEIKPYFIVLKSWVAFNVNEYQILFNIKELSNNLLSGTDVTGHRHLCQRYGSPAPEKVLSEAKISIDEMDERIRAGDLSHEDMEDLKLMIQRLRDGEFFELLTMEFSGKIKEVAKELIDFRKDIQEKIEPDIVKIASKDIPEASNQLEAINDTLEESTMKIMDINEEQMETAHAQLKELEKFISGNGDGEGVSDSVSLDEAIEVIGLQIDVLRNVGNKSMKMMEPLSFQDLVGQRIQKIIKLVRSMELRIEELIVSFGIKLQGHRKDPTKTFDDLNQDVAEYMTDLKGPQRTGEGLDQAGIDDLLANL